MKLIHGAPPKWKSKPKASPLDTDVDFLNLRNYILRGKMGEFEQKTLILHEEIDGPRLNTKHPERLVRDHLNKILKAANLSTEYQVTTRQTDSPGEWGVMVTRQPPEAMVSQKT
jgi:hypothetical protein